MTAPTIWVSLFRRYSSNITH